MWGDVAITNGGNSNNCPVNTAGNTGKSVFRAFYHIHQRAKDCRYVHHEEKENKNFSARLEHRGYQGIGFTNVAHQFKNTKHAQDPQQANDQQIIRTGKQ